ncbi:MAG: short-chain dehydrogenase/reductase [Ilumatobacteraceae bacterium]|nr:short-chain dehydrogenase/reductase [Ilumatobacteraceae bacterium]
MRFDDKVVLVTGAASGIGREIVLRMASEGATVFGHDRDAAGLEETAAMVGGMQMRVGDVADPDECKATVAACIAAHGRLDVLGNVAGIARSEHFLDVTVDQYRQMMSVNTDAAFFFCQAAIPHLLETGGNIVNIASNAGVMGQAYTVAYCTSKGAVVQLTRALAMEFVKTKLRVNAIAPSGVNTNLIKGFQFPHEADFTLMQPYLGHRPMTEPDEIAALFAFLASAEARSINGAIVNVDNGITAG